MGIDSEFVLKRFGNQLEFGPCVVGRDIDVTAIRGFGRLDELAVFSGPDVYSEEFNPTGTQRELKPKHVKEAFLYATNQNASTVTSVRAFPEVLLNVREMLAVRVLDWETNEELDFDSHSAPEALGKGVVKVEIDLSQLEFPLSEFGPEISRVDGNHRLSGVDEYLSQLAESDDSKDNESIVFTSVPFMLFLGLTIEEELKLFNDLNDKHEGMESSLLIISDVRLVKPEEMKKDLVLRPRWMSVELTRKGRAFDGIVHTGGRRHPGRRLNLSSLNSAIGTMQRHSHVLGETLDDQPEVALSIVDDYWKAVAEVFPDAWQNKKDYILLQSIGLNGFAEYGADVIDAAKSKMGKDHFTDVLTGIRDKVNLDRHSDDWEGVAGAGGARKVASMLRSSADEESLLKVAILKAVNPDQPTADQLAEDLSDSLSEGAGPADSEDNPIAEG